MHDLRSRETRQRVSRRSGSSTAIGPHEVDLTDAMAGPLRADRRGDRRGEAIVEIGSLEPATRAQHAAQVGLVEREQDSVRNSPSAVTRTRSQFSQNGSVTLGITPTSPMPSR